MSKNNIERMKEIIEEKKKISSQQGSSDRTRDKKNKSYQKAFKNTKRGGALDK